MSVECSLQLQTNIHFLLLFHISHPFLLLSSKITLLPDNPKLPLSSCFSPFRHIPLLSHLSIPLPDCEISTKCILLCLFCNSRLGISTKQSLLCFFQSFHGISNLSFSGLSADAGMLFEEGLLKLVRPSSLKVALAAPRGKMAVEALRHISRPSSAVNHGISKNKRRIHAEAFS